jgi:acyl carrier protein
MSEASIPDDLEQRIVAMVAAERSLPPEQVKLQTSLESLGFDSLDGINMCFVIEETFGIEIPNDVVNRLATVQDIVTGVRTLLDQKAAG